MDIKTWHPQQDSQDYRRLANLLVTNWVTKKNNALCINHQKNKSEFLDVIMQNFEFVSLTQAHHLEPLNKLGVETFDLITIIFGEDLNPSCLHNSLKSLNKSGVLFLRTYLEDLKESHLLTPSVANVLEEIEKVNLTLTTGEYYVHEVYNIENFRDYLIKFRETPTTVCIGMIVKNEERDLPKLLNSLDGVAEGLCVFDTGSTDNTLKIVNQVSLKNYKGSATKVYSHQYLGASTKENGEWKLWDFSKARNQYVTEIESLGYDYVLWMDADDIVKTPELLRRLRLLNQYSVFGITMSTSGGDWIHHRMWKTKKGIKYSGRCHEYPTIGGHADYLAYDCVVQHDATPIPNTEDSNDRNLRILKKEAEENPTPRVCFYLANTYKDRGAFAEAIPWYAKRIELGQHYYDEMLFAYLYKARCERATGDLTSAKQTLLTAFNHHVQWSEFSMELCYIYMQEQRYWEAIEWALRSVVYKTIPKTGLWRETNKYTDQPYRMLAWCYTHLKKPHLAYKYGLEVLKYVPNDASWISFIEQQKALIKPHKETKTFLRLGALGDIMMVTTVLQQFKEKNPDTYVRLGVHPTIRHMVEPFVIMAGVDEVLLARDCDHGTGLVGYPIAEGYPDKPMQKHLLEYFSKEVGVEPAKYTLKLPLQPENVRPVKEDYVTIQPQALWSKYKNYPLEKWKDALGQVENLPKVVLIGAANDPSLDVNPLDLRGYGFTTALLATSYAKAHLGVDSWGNHATNIVWVINKEASRQTRGVILWGSTQDTAAGYGTNINIAKEVSCRPCFKENPEISNASRGACENSHKCMELIEINEVKEAITEVVK